MKDNELVASIAFCDAAHAESLNELFSTLDTRFEIYMDEKVHSDPKNPINAKMAGMEDAKKTPPEPPEPKPDTDSSEAAKDSYIWSLYSNAINFFETYMEKCDACFDSAKSKVDELMQKQILKVPSENSQSTSENVWFSLLTTGQNGEKLEKIFDTQSLSNAIQQYTKSKEDFEVYKKKYQSKIGNRVLEPTRPSPLIFVSFVFFVAVFEFVWVWYFLSEQLGLSSAIYVSMVATTLVIVIAALCAYSHANTARDLEQMRRKLGYGGIIFCILLFLIGIGLLSGWRADSTNEGFNLVVEGYRSLTKIDVFVTAVINFGGFIFLTHEFRRFFWHYPLYHYAQRIRILKDKQAKIDEEKKELYNLLEKADIDIKNNKSEIEKYLGIMDNFHRNISEKLKGKSSELEKLVGQYHKDYREKNREYRTVEAYREPPWLEKCTFSVYDGEIGRRMDERLNRMEKRFKSEYEESTKDSSKIWLEYNEIREEEEKTIDKARDELYHKTADMRS